MFSSPSHWGFVRKHNKLKKFLHLTFNTLKSTKKLKHISVHLTNIQKFKYKNVNVKLFRVCYASPQNPKVMGRYHYQLGDQAHKKKKVVGYLNMDTTDIILMKNHKSLHIYAFIFLNNFDSFNVVVVSLARNEATAGVFWVLF